MPEFEELQLTINLVDNASAGLARVNEQIKQLGTGSSTMGMERVNRLLDEVATKIKRMGPDAEKLIGGMSGMARGAGLAAGAIVALGEAAREQTKTLKEFSSEMMRWGTLATQTGITAGTLKSMSEQMQRSGISAEAAARAMSNLSAAMADITKNRSELRAAIFKGASPEFIPGLSRLVVELETAAREGKIERFGNLLKQAGDEIFKNVERVHGSARAARARMDFLREAGAPELAEMTTPFHETTEEEKRRMDERVKNATAYFAVVKSIEQSWDRIKDAWNAISLDPDGVIVRGTRAFAAALEAASRALEKIEPVLKSVINLSVEFAVSPGGAILNRVLPAPAPNAAAPPSGPAMTIPPLSPSQTPLRFMSGGGGGLSFSTDEDYERSGVTYIEDRRGERATDDRKKFLDENTAQLRRLNDYLQGTAAPGGGAFGFISGGVGAPGGALGGAIGGSVGGSPMGRLPGFGGGGGVPSLGGGGLGGGGGSRGGGGPSGGGGSRGGGGPSVPSVPSIPGAVGGFDWTKVPNPLAPPGEGGGTGTGATGAMGGGAGVTGGLSREAFDKHFAGTPLAGQYDTVVSEANKHGVSPALLAAIMSHESGRGTSKMIREKLNPAGLMDPKTNWSTGQTFPTIEAGIASAARNVSKNLEKGGGTIPGMAPIYAPVGAANDPKNLNRFWPGNVTKLFKEFGGTDPSVPRTAGTPGSGSATLPGIPSGVKQLAAPAWPDSPFGPPGGGSGAKTAIGAQTDGVPSEILAQAREVAKLGPKELSDFMRDKGYPKEGNWCGEFAAAVVASTGGAPPKGAPVASTWRTFGEEVKDPMPGDIAVRRGPRTGELGSHVTFVEEVGKDTFTGLGGNQGRTRSGENRWRSEYSRDRFQFFRPPGGGGGGGGALTGRPSGTTAGMKYLPGPEMARTESSSPAAWTDSIDTGLIDRMMGREIRKKVEGTGNVDVKVSSTPPTETKTPSFKASEISGMKQMEPTSSGAPEPAKASEPVPAYEE